MRIITISQYHENYGFPEGKFYWKPKGVYYLEVVAEEDRSDVYYQNLADQLQHLAEWKNDGSRAEHVKTVYVPEGTLFKDEVFWNDGADRFGGSRWKADRTFTVESLEEEYRSVA